MIVLRKNADRRIAKGHMWIFSNEIADPAVSSLRPGDIHEVSTHKGEFVGMAYVNPASLITARILSRRRIEIDETFLRDRIHAAHERRRVLYPNRDHYRIVFGESDLLPGLVVDKYRDVIVVQSLTAGIERMIGAIVQILVELFEPQCIFLRNDSQVRNLEGLPLEKRPAYGDVPENVTIQSGSLNFLVDIVGGQKTGHFLDQADNREAVHRYVSQGDVVGDLFSYSGAWGLHAAAAGAERVECVDSSQPALETAMENARLNGLEEKVFLANEPVLSFLKRTRESYDLIVLDPPAFVKNRHLVKEGVKGYIDVNRRALTKLKSGGILITCSCSHHLDWSGFEDVLGSAARQSGKDLRILETMGQGPDHPYLLAMPETRYLKVIVAQAV